jgi:thioredoxin reductase (NADPH)
MSANDKNEQFYRDTESIAFPKLDDRQLALLEPLGERHALRKGENVFEAGQRDFGMTVILRGELEVFETRDGLEQILATLGPRDFVGDVAMLTGTSALTTARGKAEVSEILIVGSVEFRKTLAELHGLGEPIVRALMMRRERLLRDCQFAGLRIVAVPECREGHQIDDFLDKNHIPHRLIEPESHSS